MSTAEQAAARPEGPGEAGARARRDPWPLLLAGVLLLAFGLRAWGVKQGLPFAYNADENAHFVPKAIGLFGHSLNPHYFINPPGYSYLLHIVFAVWFGGREGVSNAYATNPTEVFVVARLTAGVLGVLATWLVYVAGTRLFQQREDPSVGRRAGLLGALVMAVAFLPVFYSHLALNDVPALAPACLSLAGTAGVLRRGRPVDWLLAGAGLGLGAATKYTAGVVLLPLLAVAALRLWDGRASGAWKRELGWLVATAAASIAAFLIANPFALLASSEFRDGLQQQSTAAGDDALGKLGLTEGNGIAYYLWTLTWGLGWIPALAALAGALLLVVERNRLALVLVPAPVLFLVFMGTQDRFFGRWLLPVFPLLALLAGYAGVRLAQLAARGSARRVAVLTAAAGALLAAQGLVYSVHNDRLLSRDDTRSATRAWMVAHIPPRTKIVLEPTQPDQWATDPGHPLPQAPDGSGANGSRWNKWRTSRSTINDDGTILKSGSRIVNIEDYERTLRPALIDSYRKGGYCWVITGSNQAGRAYAEPGKVPRAIAYYRALEQQADRRFEISPYGDGSLGPYGGVRPRVDFSFDWSFDWYPLAYDHPGQVMIVYQLRNCPS